MSGMSHPVSLHDSGRNPFLLQTPRFQGCLASLCIRPVNLCSVAFVPLATSTQPKVRSKSPLINKARDILPTLVIYETPKSLGALCQNRDEDQICISYYKSQYLTGFQSELHTQPVLRTGVSPYPQVVCFRMPVGAKNWGCSNPVQTEKYLYLTSHITSSRTP